jgi:hypothetical protein
MGDLERFAENTMKTTAFSNAQDYVKTVSSSTDSLFIRLFTELIDLAQTLVEAVIGGVQALIDKAFDALASVLSSLKSIFFDPWPIDIPFVTPFWRFITTDEDYRDGRELSVAGLVSLAIAIPATILFKLLEDKPPFADQNSVNKFRESFSGAKMLQNYKSAGDPRHGEAELAPLGDPRGESLVYALGIANSASG